MFPFTSPPPHTHSTPKQKVKVRVTQPPLLALLTKHMDAKGKQAKLKSPNQMQVGGGGSWGLTPTHRIDANVSSKQAPREDRENENKDRSNT